MDRVLLVFLGGGIGSALRYGAGRAIGRLTPEGADTPHWLAMYPVATMLVNISGCACIGLLWGIAHARAGAQGVEDPEPGWMVFAAAGILGGFTTFSSFGWETLSLVQDGRAPTAMAYALLSVVVGVVCAWSGYTLGAAIAP